VATEKTTTKETTFFHPKTLKLKDNIVIYVLKNYAQYQNQMYYLLLEIGTPIC